MAESQVLGVLRLWAAIAWADGKLADRERESLRRLIGLAALEGDELARAEALLTDPSELPSDLAELTDDARRGIYRTACRIAMVDDELAEAERALLDQLRTRLELTAEVAKQIEYAVPGVS